MHALDRVGLADKLSEQTVQFIRWRATTSGTSSTAYYKSRKSF